MACRQRRRSHKAVHHMASAPQRRLNVSQMRSFRNLVAQWPRLCRLLAPTRRAPVRKRQLVHCLPPLRRRRLLQLQVRILASVLIRCRCNLQTLLLS